MTDILCRNANISVLLLVRVLFYVVRLLYDINIYVDRYRVTSRKRFAKFRSVASVLVDPVWISYAKQNNRCIKLRTAGCNSIRRMYEGR